MVTADRPAGGGAVSDAGGTGCRHGHRPTRSPAIDPRWGFVPSRTSAWFGVVVYLALAAVAGWLLPASWLLWLGAVAVVALVIAAAIQVLVGHRGRCWWVRTFRWYFGVVGALVDPVDQG